jgi:hypothetical protein
MWTVVERERVAVPAGGVILDPERPADCGPGARKTWEQITGHRDPTECTQG